MTRFFDILFSIIGLVFLSPIILFILILCYFDTTAPLFQQKRVGRNKKPFHLYKFRSMYINTQSVATHLVQSSSVTKWGSFLRKYKLDELPQLINVLLGDMSLVGPRPNLYNQEELILEREARKVYSIRPGITGLAQIQKIDMSTPKLLAETDAKMMSNMSLFQYFKYIIFTLIGKGFGDRILI